MPLDHVLAAFGITDAHVQRQPSFSSSVHRISAGGRRLFLKEHAPEDAPRIQLAAQITERLGRHGLARAGFVSTTDGKLYVRYAGSLFTLGEPAGDRPLTTLDLTDHDSARRLGEYLARLHGVLNDAPALEPPPSKLWRDADHAGRTARSRAALRTLPPSPGRDTMLRALTDVEQTPAARAPLATAAAPVGVVHGDFWPGNVIVGAALGVIDLEGACRAPLLLDVAHFADLGFRSLAGWRKTREMDLSLATTFARAYAAASSMPLDDLRTLPDLLVAARGCSILWLVERHLDIGPSPTDQLVENDRCTMQFVTRIADRWREDLSAAALVP